MGRCRSRSDRRRVLLVSPSWLRDGRRRRRGIRAQRPDGREPCGLFWTLFVCCTAALPYVPYVGPPALPPWRRRVLGRARTEMASGFSNTGLRCRLGRLKTKQRFMAAVPHRARNAPSGNVEEGDAIHSGVHVVSTARARIGRYFVPFLAGEGNPTRPLAPPGAPAGPPPANQRPAPVRIGQPGRDSLTCRCSGCGPYCLPVSTFLKYIKLIVKLRDSFCYPTKACLFRLSPGSPPQAPPALPWITDKGLPILARLKAC